MDKILAHLLNESGVLDETDDNMLLLNLIPYLRHLPYKEGGEGRAYFVFDKLIVKEFLNFDDEYLFSSMFDNYCREMKKFYDKGYAVPKIYSWVKIPSVINNSGKHKIAYRYYVLEEQVKGRELFSGLLEDTYHLCKNLCDEKTFDKLVLNPEIDKSLYAEMVANYIKDYITMNKTIEAMDERQLERVIYSVYQMFKFGEFSVPDMYPSNMLYNDGEVVMIDNNFSERKNDEIYLKHTADDFTLTGMLFMFLYNEQVSGFKKSKSFKEKDKRRINALISKNTLFCEQAIKKVLKVGRRMVDEKLVLDDKIMLCIFETLNNIMDSDKALQIMKIAQPNL